MRRQLGGFESAQAWTGASFPYNAVTVLRLAGRPDEERLRRALAGLQRRHPLLRARLERRGSRWWFDVGESAPIPLRRVERQSDEAWRPVAEEELNTALEIGTAPLARCVLVASAADDAASEIVICLHHAIIDATSGATICRQLLEMCAGGVAAPVESGELPPRPEDRFPPRFRGLSRYPRIVAFVGRRLAEELRYLWRSRGVRSPVPAGPARCRVLPARLGKKATAALVRRCRRERVPVNAAVNAALLRAVQGHRYDNRPVPLRYFAFPDLRSYLRPPMGADAVASYLSIMRFTAYLDCREPFWELARRLGGQLYRSFKRGEKYLFCLTSAALLRMIIRYGKMRFGSVAVAYNGPLDLPRDSGELGVRGVHGFVSNMPIGAELTSNAVLFRGRLCWDFVYLDVDMDETQASTIVAHILELLEEAAHERS